MSRLLTSFIEMLREGVIPNQSSYPCAVVCAANLGALGTGRSIHASAIKFLGELGLFLSSSLVSFYAKCGVMEDGLLMFMNMKEKNIVSWNACICGHAQNGQGKEAIQVYRMMREGGIEPNSVTLLGLLTAISHAGLVEDGYRYFNEARQKGTSLLTAEHYACMIDLLSRSGRFREAEMFIHDLPFDPGVGFWKALLGGCQVHSNTKLGEAAIRKILDLNPGDISSYVMLSNALSAAGRWENVVDIRGMMKNKGLTRVPGNSWIEIKSKVHVFVTGDRNHSNMHEIHTLIGFHIQHAVDYEVAIDDVA